MKTSSKTITLLLVLNILVLFAFQGAQDSRCGELASSSVPKTGKSLTYRIEMDYTLTHTSSEVQTYLYKIPRFLDNGPFQEIVYSSLIVNGPNLKRFVHIDKFLNVFDVININLRATESLVLDFTYELTLNEVNLSNIDVSLIGSYDEVDPKISSNYLDVSGIYFEANSAELRALSNELCRDTSNVIEKARNIHDWVAENIQYEIQAEEMGAQYAYLNKKGDCSDFSDLMITLLRIQGIPARKITGPIYTDILEPQIGDNWSYFFDYDGASGNIEFNLSSGHAWLEYYVPNYGWIACDPTWSQSDVSYFNYMDCVHFYNTFGAWFLMPDMAYSSEISNLPLAYTLDHSFYSDCMTLTIEVIEPPDDVIETIPIENQEAGVVIVVFSVIIIISILATVIVVMQIRTRSKKSSSNANKMSIKPPSKSSMLATRMFMKRKDVQIRKYKRQTVKAKYSKPTRGRLLKSAFSEVRSVYKTWHEERASVKKFVTRELSKARGKPKPDVDKLALKEKLDNLSKKLRE